MCPEAKRFCPRSSTLPTWRAGEGSGAYARWIAIFPVTANWSATAVRGRTIAWTALRGQRKVDETAPANPHPLPARKLGAEELEAALRHGGELIIEKHDVDVVAGNANARPLLSRLAREYEHIVVYGVYTDVCVDHAINALLEQATIPYVVVDAIHEIDPANAAAARERWRKAGVRTITCAELEDLLDS